MLAGLTVRHISVARALVLATISGCTPPPATVPVVRAPVDDATTTTTATSGDADLGAAAHARLVALMGLPRALGHPDRAASIDALERMLLHLGAPSVQRFETTGDDPLTGRTFELTSLVAHLRPDAPRRFVLATHFDTRPWADESPDPADHARPVPGANDGTSGLALVLELGARLPARLPEGVGLSIVLFDGEELGRPGFDGGYCVGSRDLAERLAEGDDPVLARAELGIVLDMVGDADLHVPIEPGSLSIHPELVRHVWATARELGHDALDEDPRAIGVIDDHRALTDAGIPSILLIDRDYDAWHTTRDTIDRVSAASLHAVGDTVLVALARWYAR
jgi:glutaminyl-peptide cyclotransferase